MKDSRRGKNVALIGAISQLAFAIVLLIVWRWAGSAAARACMLMLACGTLLWLMAALLMYCRQLAELEQQELTDLADDTSASIFEGDSLADQRIAARRLMLVERWVVPIFTLVWAGVNVWVGYLLLRVAGSAGAPDVVTAGQASLLAIVAAFGALLLSCYATGMARQADWRPLRAPGSYMLVCTLMIVGTIVALIAGWQKIAAVDKIVAYVIPICQLVLAAEMIVNFILERYRPHVAGAEERLSFDSRLMNLVAEPKRVGHSIAETLNYQFGFEVSHTWFYQLLQRACVPLLIFAVMVMFGITAIVPVGQGQSAVITRLGEMQDEPLGPGLHLKWPWPIDTAVVFDQHVRMMPLGTGGSEEHRGKTIHGGTFDGRELALWTEQHGGTEEMNFVVAVDLGQDYSGKAPPVNVIRLTAVLDYRIVDPVKFGYRFEDASAMLNCLAHREMVLYCSSATLLEDSSNTDGVNALRPQAIMTHGRAAMAAGLKERIQRAIDAPAVDLGIEVVSLSLTAVHPPQEVAEDFEKVLSARFGQQMQRSQAQADAARKFISAAGDAVLAQKLALALRQRSELTSLLNSQANNQPAAFAEKLDAMIKLVDKHMAVLNSDLAQDDLLGGAADESAEDTKEVLAAMVEYRLLLEGIASNDGEPDLAAMIDQAEDEAEKFLDRARGQAAVTIAQASIGRWKRESQYYSRASTFPAQLAVYRASPDLYALDLYMDVWDRVLPGAVKYVVGFDPDRLEPRLDLERDSRFEQRVRFERETEGP